MSKNKFLFILAAASLLTLGSCGAQTVTSSASTQGSSSSKTSSAALASSSSAVASSSNIPSSTASSSITSSASSSSSQQESQDGLIFTLNEDKTSYSVTGNDNSKANVTIPSAYKGLPVTAIGDSAFYNSDVIQVVMPDSVTTIGQNAFAYCSKLVSVTLSQRLISIGNLAFDNSAIASLSLPESLTKVGTNAFPIART